MAVSVGTRNTRLAAIHSFFRFASYRHPEHAETIQQVLAIPQKKTETRPPVLPHRDGDGRVARRSGPQHLERATRPRPARRSHLQTGLRLSELTGLRCQDVELGTGAHVKCLGKGRKRRDTPLDKTTVSLLRAWLGERGGEPDDPLFPSRQGGRLSSDAVQRLVAKHVAAARASCPSLGSKRISTHNLRHSCAMDLLRQRRGRRNCGAMARPREARVRQRLRPRRLTMKERALEPAITPQGASRQVSADRRAPRLPRGPLIMPSSWGGAPP